MEAVDIGTVVEESSGSGSGSGGSGEVVEAVQPKKAKKPKKEWVTGVANWVDQKTEVVVDQEFLIEVLGIQTTTQNDSYMHGYLEFVLETWKKSFKRRGIPLTIEKDAYGNLYATKGVPPDGQPYPTCVAHTDTVHSMETDFHIRIGQAKGDRLYAWNREKNLQVGIGGDDKVGVYVALEHLRHLPYAKVAFFRHEESGCQGSQKANMAFFDDSAYVLQADRRGWQDFVDEIYGVKLGSKSWYKALEPVWKQYGRKRSSGALTDVYTLKKNGLHVSCANVSCGYYQPHSRFEVVYVEDVNNTLAMFLRIARDMGDRKWGHVYEPAKSYGKTWHGGHGGGGYGGYDDWDGWEKDPKTGSYSWVGYGNSSHEKAQSTNGNGPGTGESKGYWARGKYHRYGREYASYDEWYQEKFGLDGATDTKKRLDENAEKTREAVEALQRIVVEQEMASGGLSTSRMGQCSTCGDDVWMTRIGFWCNGCQHFYEAPKQEAVQDKLDDDVDEAPEEEPLSAELTGYTKRSTALLVIPQEVSGAAPTTPVTLPTQE